MFFSKLTDNQFTMNLLSVILIFIIAIIHIYILYLEMFLWTKKKGIRVFGLKSKAFAEETKVLAANQGLYNGFLAAGLFYSLYSENNANAVFFCSCVAIAGLYGWCSTKKASILIIQTIPAVITLLSFLL